MIENTNQNVTNNVNYPYKRKVKSKIVVVLEGKSDNRGLNLINTRSRALCKNEIHEIIISDEADAGPGKIVNSISYLGFVEIIEGGVILTGDNIYLNDKLIGYVAGYDETHFPNHINIVLYSENRLTGLEIGTNVDDLLYFINCSN
jgi:hypothetical protein